MATSSKRKLWRLSFLKVESVMDVFSFLQWRHVKNDRIAMD